MATAEELLAQMEENPELYADSIGPVNDVIVINAEERTIELPESEKKFGTESDKKSERKHFKCPRIVGDNIDLSTLNLSINFKNANNEADIYPIEDVEVDGDYITFSWLLSKKVTAYKTDASENQLLSFIFCAKSGEDPDVAWNTTLCSDGVVLEGLEPGESIVEDNPDIIQYILERLESAGTITPEQISEAVKGYLASNPIKETDPTVPAWAKEETPDKSLTQEGKAADAKEVGDRLGQLSATMEELTKELDTNSESGLTATVKNALLEVVANVAWATTEGQACYDKLKTALNESAGEIKLSSITAVCIETAQVGTAASDLDIVVTAVYSDGSSAQVTGWTTSGTVVEGTNTFMVSYGGKNTTVTVTGVNAVTVMLENYTKSVTQLKSTTYTDDGNTPVASSGQWYINTNSGAFIQSTPLDEDVTVNISCIPDANCYNGAWVGQVDDGYGLVPSGENAAQTNVYYYKSIASQMLVDTEYSLSNYTIKSGYRLIWNSGGKNTVTPTVEVVS